MQTLLSLLIVAGCAGYVLWTVLLPAAARRRVLAAMGRASTAPAARGCAGCDGCARAPSTPDPAVQVVNWRPRRRG